MVLKQNGGPVWPHVPELSRPLLSNSLSAEPVLLAIAKTIATAGLAPDGGDYKAEEEDVLALTKALLPPHHFEALMRSLAPHLPAPTGLRSQLLEAQEELEATRASLTTSQASLRSLEDHNAITTRQLDELADVLGLPYRPSEAGTDLVTQRGTVADLVRAADEVATTASVACDSTSRQSKTILELEMKLQEALEARDRLEAQTSSLTKDLSSLAESTQTALDAKTDALSNLESELESVTSELDALKAGLDLNSSSLSAGSHISAGTRLSELKQELNDTKALVEEAEEAAARYIGSNKMLKRELEAVKAALELEKAACTALMKDSRAKKESDEHEAESSAARIKELEETLDIRTAELEKSRKETKAARRRSSGGAPFTPPKNAPGTPIPSTPMGTLDVRAGQPSIVSPVSPDKENESPQALADTPGWMKSPSKTNGNSLLNVPVGATRTPGRVRSPLQPVEPSDVVSPLQPVDPLSPIITTPAWLADPTSGSPVEPPTGVKLFGEDAGEDWKQIQEAAESALTKPEHAQVLASFRENKDVPALIAQLADLSSVSASHASHYILGVSGKLWRRLAAAVTLIGWVLLLVLIWNELGVARPDTPRDFTAEDSSSCNDSSSPFMFSWSSMSSEDACTTTISSSSSSASSLHFMNECPAIISARPT